MPSEFTLDDFEEAPASEFSLSDFEEEPALRPEIGELRQAVTPPDLGAVPFAMGGVNAPPIFQASIATTVPSVVPPPEAFVPAIPRQPVSGELSTTFGGPPKPLASYAETMESLQESGTPISRIVAPRPIITEPRIDIPEVPIPKEAGFWNAAGREAVNAAASVPEFLSSDAGILAAMSAKLAPRLTSAGFSIDLFHSAFEQAKNLYQNWGQMTPAERGKASVDTLASLVLGGTTGAHAAGVKLPTRAKPVEEAKPEVAEVVPSKPTEAPADVTSRLETAIRNPEELKKGNALSSTLGLEVKSIEDLENLAKLHEKIAKENRALLDELQTFPPEERGPRSVELFSAALRNQLVRETAGVATDTAWVEGEGTIPTKLGPRPLDWKTNPEVADWLLKNADRLDLKLPDALKARAAKPAAVETAVAKANRPAVKLMPDAKGNIQKIPAELKPDGTWETHDEIIARNGLKTEDIDRRIFVDEQGNEKPREQTAQELAAAGVETKVPGEAHSTDLPPAKPPDPAPAAPTTDLTVVGKVGEMSPEEVRSAVMQSVIEGGAIEGLRPGKDKTGFWVIAPAEKGIEGDQPMAIGPFVSKDAADTFLESEVGAPGAKVVEVTKAPTPSTPPTPTAKEPWQMTAVEARRAFPTLTQEKWDAAVTAAWKDGRLTEDSAPVQSMMRSKPRDFGEIDAVLNGRMEPSADLLKRHPDLAKPTPAPAAEKKGEVPTFQEYVEGKPATYSGRKRIEFHRYFQGKQAGADQVTVEINQRVKGGNRYDVEHTYYDTPQGQKFPSVQRVRIASDVPLKEAKQAARTWLRTVKDSDNGGKAIMEQPTPPPGTQGLAVAGEVPVELEALRKVDLKDDPRLDMPGITRKVKPNSLVVQIRDLESLPIRDIVLKSSGDPITDAQLVEKTIRANLHGNTSLRESLAVTTGPNGRAVLKFGISPNGMTWAPAKAWIDLVEQAKVQRGETGLAKGLRQKWTGATDPTLGSEAGFVSLAPIQALIDRTSPYVKAVVDTIMAVGKHQFDIGKATDFRRSVFHWSAKLQRSFGEAASAQKEIRTKVPDKTRREGITNWIQAAGDPTILASRRADTEAWRDPKTGKPHPQQKQLLAGYDAALHLTPEEIAVAQDVKRTYDKLGARGQTYDILKTFKDNYVTQIWNLRRGPIPKGAGVGRSLMLKDRFRFAKASTFDTFFDGEQAGYVPRTKDISDILPLYMHEMNSVIAARQLVEQMAGGVGSDGRKLLAPRGVGMAVEGDKGKATLVMPDVPAEKTRDYVIIENQPALHEWRWVTKDAAGNPVFNKSDLMVHPEVADHFRNVLGRSAIKEWYRSRTTASAEIPKAIARGLDFAQSETKRTMLGVLTPFHQVQEGTHAVGHRVNPFFNNPKIDLVNDAGQMDAAKHGLMLLPDRTSSQQFMEGFKQSALVTKIPVLGPLADHYSEYLFHQYIPGIKYKTYQAILQRNTHLYGRELTAGRATLEDIKILSAEQANAAYGHLNYADLGRNPTILHIMRLGLLAPDFLEARARFAGQAIKGVGGAKIGREQLVALATLALAQASLSYIMANITGGTWDEKDPFAFHVGNKKFTMRSVPEDAYRFAKDTRSFVYARLNPIIGRGAVQYASGVDWRGQKVTKARTTKELLTQPVPLFLRPLVGLGNTPLMAWEEIAAASGLKISRYSAVSEMYKVAHQWKADNPDPKVQRVEARYEASSFPDSDYKPLRESLIKNDMKGAMTAYEELLKTGHPHKDIDNVMKPWTGGTVNKATGELTPRHPKAFTSAKLESRFVQSLTDEQRATYNRAIIERRELYARFQQMLSQQQPKPKLASEFSLKDFE